MSNHLVMDFLRDEQGAGAIWAMFWFMVLTALAGISVDGTNAFRNQTILQATADAAALAAAIDLPRTANATSSAIEYAEMNMPPGVYGDVLVEEDIEFGVWDPENRVLYTDAASPDAVSVTLRANYARGNAIFASFLRVAGVEGWELEARAVAQKFTPQCFTDGLVARGYVDTSSNNAYYNNFCVHGQQGVYIQNGNTFEPGTSVSMPDLSLLEIPTDGFDSNPGLREALREGVLDPHMVDRVPEIMEMLLDPGSPLQPIYIDQSKPVVEVDCRFDLGTAEEGRIYHVVCPDNKQVQIPGGELMSQVVIIAESQVNIPANAMLEDVILASRAIIKNDGSNIHFASGAQLGRVDDCADGGGVQIFTTENVFLSSSVRWNGVQVVTAKNAQLGASDYGVKGLAVQAGGNITLTSNNDFGLCNGDDPLILTHQRYRLVF